MELSVIGQDTIKKACAFISATWNICLTTDQMISLLFMDSDILDDISDFGIDNAAVLDELNEHFCRSLTGMNIVEYETLTNKVSEADIHGFILKLQDKANKRFFHNGHG